eukprot:1326640-Ditylum_brightwellii.AAC.1
MNTRVEHWGASLPRWANALWTWEEAGVVKTKTKTTPKMKPRSVTCLMAGFAVNHSGGVYRMWIRQTNRILVSQDVTWLKRMYFQPQLQQEELVVSKKIVSIEDRESDGIMGSSTADTDAEKPDSTGDGVNMGHNVGHGADDGNNMGDNVGHGTDNGNNMGDNVGHGAEDGVNMGDSVGDEEEETT